VEIGKAKHVMEGSRATVVSYGRQMPIVEEIANEMAGVAKVCKVNVDECQDLTPMEALVIVELASRINRSSRSPIPLLLAGDEAQYWDWSRRLELSYYSKGPGVAWIIAASTWAFGVSEWAVRLPAAVASFVATLALARLAARLTGGDERVGFVAAVLYQAAPVFYATSQFMTIDAPYFACWIAAAAAGWRIAPQPRQYSNPFGQGRRSRSVKTYRRKMRWCWQTRPRSIRL